MGNRRLGRFIVILLASMSVGGVAAANPVLVNGSFESGLTGWTSVGTVPPYRGPFANNNSDPNAMHAGPGFDGVWWLFLGGRDAFGYIEQAITGLDSNTPYAVTFLIASEASIGDSLTVSMTSGSSSPSQLFTPPPSSLGGWGTWVSREYEFVTGSLATQATLRFTSAPLGTGVDHFDIGLDNVSIRVVPEPSSSVLVATSVLSLGLIR